MKKNKNLNNLEFLTALASAILLFALTYLQYQKQSPFWWLILIASILMAANAWVKYKNIKNEEDK